MDATQENERTVPFLFELLAVAALLLLGRAYFDLVSSEQYGAPLDYYQLAPWFGSREAASLLAYFLFSLPCCALLMVLLLRFLPSLLDELAKLRPAQPEAALALALLSAAAALIIRHYVFHGADFTDDERIYKFQAELLLRGHFSMLPPAPHALFYNNLMVMTPAGQISGVFPIGMPLLIALFKSLGLLNLLGPLLVAGTVLAVGTLAAALELARPGRFLAMLAAGLSPMLILQGATLHNIVGATLCFTMALSATLRFMQAPRAASAAWLGAWIGAAFLMRPPEGAEAGLFALAVTAGLLYRKRLSPALWLRHAAVCLAVAMLVALPQLVQNYFVTGNALISPYQLLAQQRPYASTQFGFGTVLPGVTQTPYTAVQKTVSALFRTNLWALGWPVSLFPLVLIFGQTALRKRALTLLLMALATQLMPLLHTAPALPDFGSAYNLLLVPILAVALALVVPELVPHIGTRRVTAALVSLVLVAAILFVPVQLERLRVEASTTRSAVEAAEETARRNGPLVVLWSRMYGGPAKVTWVYLPPPVADWASAPVIWLRNSQQSLDYARRFFPNRSIFRLGFSAIDKPQLDPVP